jgi:hypothetical protein
MVENPFLLGNPYSPMANAELLRIIDQAADKEFACVILNSTSYCDVWKLS